jgi:hypothetical protein
VQDEELKEMFAPSMIDTAKLKLELFEKYGYLPAAGDRHIAEFFDCYLKNIGQAEQKYGVKPTSMKERAGSWFEAVKALTACSKRRLLPAQNHESISRFWPPGGQGIAENGNVNLPEQGG